MKIYKSPIPFHNYRSQNLADATFWKALGKGSLMKLHGHIYVDKSAFYQLPVWEQSRIQALASGYSAHKAVVCGLSAARLWGLPVIVPSSPTELALPGDNRPPRKSLWPSRTVYRHAFLPAEAIKRFERFNVTTPARTVIDVARWHGFHIGLAVADGFLRQGGKIAELKKEVEKIGRAKGSAVARRVIDCASSKSESAAESWARAQIIEASLPFKMMELQKEIHAQEHVYFVDIVIDDWLIIEVDGDQKYLGDYGNSAEVVLAELKREKRLKNLGYEFLRADWNMLRDGEFIPEVTSYLTRPSRRPAPDLQN